MMIKVIEKYPFYQTEVKIISSALQPLLQGYTYSVAFKTEFILFYSARSLF